jgi:hypothetical protein
VPDDESYLGLGKSAVLSAPSDIIGAALLAMPSGFSLKDVTAAIPPIRDLHHVYTWTATRESAVDVILSPKGDDLQNMGLPTPWLMKYAYQQSFFGNSTPINRSWSASNVHDGLVGGYLPVPVFLYPDFAEEPSRRYWEMQIAPMPFGGGNEVPLHVRYVRVEEGRVKLTRYVDQFAQNCQSTSISTSEPAEHYYAALLDQKHFWQRELGGGCAHLNGCMSELVLPARNDTDGSMLFDQLRMGLVRDMITRNQRVWPRYGVGGVDGGGYGGFSNNGFQEIFTSSMMASLTNGLYDYSRDVLLNYLQFYSRRSGGVQYRGLEMAQSARMLTVIAAYYEHTHDSTPFQRYEQKIRAIVGLLLKRRAIGLALLPSAEAYGMLTGNDEADLYGETIANPNTELPFMSITAEAWRGFRDLGRAYSAWGRREQDAAAVAFGQALSGNATLIWADFRRAMARSTVVSPTGDPVCHPYVFGVPTCTELPPDQSRFPSARDSESWRTYSEAFYSGALSRDEVGEILEWHKRRPTLNGSSLKAGCLAGSGGALLNGDQLMTFTGHGFAYGLLQHDFVDDFLLAFYTTSAHAYTRGQWVAPESASIDRTQKAVDFATPSGLSVPIFLRWLLVFEDPLSEMLWLGKAVPREWLEAGERLQVADAPTRFGRLSFVFNSAREEITVNVTTADGFRWPVNGIKLRVRSHRPWLGVRIGGRTWPAALVNTTEQTVWLKQATKGEVVGVSLDGTYDM